MTVDGCIEERRSTTLKLLLAMKEMERGERRKERGKGEKGRGE